MTTQHQFRAYDTVTEWSGPVRATEAEAEKDADRHDAYCVRQGGYGSAIVVRRTDGDRLETVDGKTVWPPHGRTSGAARWVGGDS
jgi:hypothetical protein